MRKFYVENVTHSIRRIVGMPAVCMYLVEGCDKAILIDTGCGEAGLKEYVEELLRGKPYEVLLTHGHVDHAAGAGAFEQVWLHPADWALAKRHCTLENRLGYWEHCKPILGDILFPAAGDLVPNRTKPFLPLADGQKFLLGGVTLQVMCVPGHTKGIVVPFVPEEEIAFFGDACGTGTLLVGEESTTVQKYYNSLLRMKGRAPIFRKVLRQHGNFEASLSILDENIELCRKILNRKDDAVPHSFMSFPCFRAMQVNPKTRKRADGKEGNIVYCKDKIR